MEKKKILFVDDEPNILSGLRRMLRSMRNDFELHFAENGWQALELMEQECFDVVVSDMRMPGMDGAQLLTEIQQRFPHAIRIMLTGQADEESVMRTIGVVHQFLAKPCDPDILKEVLVRAAALQDRMTNGNVKNIISGLGTLPSLPAIYAKLQKVLKDSNAIADDVSEIIEQDIAMTAKLLQLVNSSFFGLFQKVESPARAVKLLGLDTIKYLVLGVQIFSEIKIASPVISLDNLWSHSMAVANCSKKIALAETANVDLVNSCFIAGMLHDIGKLLLLSHLVDEYTAIIENAQKNGTELMQEEMRLLHATHGDIGAYLVGLWGFSGEIIEAIAFHNRLNQYPGSSFSVALAVHVANICYYEHFPEMSVGEPPQLDKAYLVSHEVADKIDGWRELCMTILENNEDEQ